MRRIQGYNDITTLCHGACLPVTELFAPHRPSSALHLDNEGVSEGQNVVMWYFPLKLWGPRNVGNLEPKKYYIAGDWKVC